MRVRRSIALSGVLLAITILSAGWLFQRGVDERRNVYQTVRMLQEVVEHIATKYVEPVQRDSLYHAALEGLIESLGDPNSSFMSAPEWSNLQARTRGDYGGVGLYISERNGWVTVIGPVPGTPGSRAGIRMGDRIVEIDGQSTEGWSVSQAVDVLKGEPGTAVAVKIGRPGVPEPIAVTLTRAKIELKSVPFAKMLSGRIGYVPLRNVSETSALEIRQAVDSLTGEGMRGLILDLRGNQGGLLHAGIEVTDLFLDAGAAIVETRGRIESQNLTYRARSEDRYTDVPVVVLVNVQSASAAEIIAGALQDHDRALILGVRTFGKGSVQSIIPLSTGERLRLTTARWYTPVGRSIDKSQEDRLAAVVEGGPLTIDGSLTTGVGSEAEPVTFKTDGGRTVFGGGGITPDVVLLGDTLTDAEGENLEKIFQFGGAFNTALFNYTVDYARRNPSLSPPVRLQARDFDEFYASLAELEVEVDRKVFDGALRYIRYRLEREIAREAGGEAGEFAYQEMTDKVLRRAIGLLREAEDPRSLFEAAGIALLESSADSTSGVRSDDSK